MKKIIAVDTDVKGKITGVLLGGNVRYTPMDTLKTMVANGEVEGVELVKKKDGTSYVRSLPDGTAGNNLTTLAAEPKTAMNRARNLWRSLSVYFR